MRSASPESSRTTSAWSPRRKRDLVGAIVHFDAALAISRSLGTSRRDAARGHQSRTLSAIGQAEPAEVFRRSHARALSWHRRTDNFRTLAERCRVARGRCRRARRYTRRAPDSSVRQPELEGRTLDAEYRDEWSDASAQSVRSALGDRALRGVPGRRTGDVGGRRGRLRTGDAPVHNDLPSGTVTIGDRRLRGPSALTPLHRAHA